MTEEVRWHFEVLLGQARRFEPGKTYDDKDEYASIVTVQFMGKKRVWLSGFLNNGEAGPINRHHMAALIKMLRDELGVEVINAERGDKEKTYNTGPAPL